MYKEGKWAKRILDLQESDGKWGCFHSLSQFYNSPITTEQALRRLERLGYTIEDSFSETANMENRKEEILKNYREQLIQIELDSRIRHRHNF